MNLKKYFSKRNLKKTPEPSGNKQKKTEQLHFCVQKHAARRLHYDFRLEYKGVLLSWAVPKGPSLNPQDKRLAIKVEDHPLDYQYFEGVIPKGNYGAGTVEIWDHGTFHSVNATTREETESAVTKGLKTGHFAIMLNGDKLNGEFIFQKLKTDSDDNSWLLIKKNDEESYEEPIINEPPKRSVKKKPLKLPEFIPPMLATLIEKPFNDENWLFEIKWDGFRALAFIDENKVQLKSRNKNLLNEQFPTIVTQLKKIKKQLILDGELVVVDSKGKSDFQLMQNYQREGKGTLVYYVFDLLFLDGEDLRNRTLIERKQLLQSFLKEYSLPLIRYTDHILAKGEPFFKEASKLHLEGIIGKKSDSLYQSKRSRDWVKIKTSLRQEVVIGGFTAPRGSRKHFGALLVGVYNDKNELEYAGHVGGGFNEALLTEINEKLQKLVQTKSPFLHPPKANAPVTWVKPKLICEVSFSEWTKDNMMRQPIFHGLRTDKEAKSVKKETAEMPIKSPTPNKKDSKNTLELTHLDKIFWPEEKYTKGDLIHYYETVAPFILPHLKDRPIMLHRYPNGIQGTDFYQKDIGITHPSWINTFSLEQEGKLNHYLLINDQRSLLYAVNLGTIDLHPFLSRYQHVDNPDFCVIDLDPHGIPFQKVTEIALFIHQLLNEIDVKHYCKTSGGNGLHILIPLNAKYDSDQSRQFAEIIGNYVNQQFPTITSVERSPKKREKKIYIDCLQNRPRQSIVAPYSVRPRPHALVSTPLDWEELNKELEPRQFDINNVPARLKEKGDIFKPVLGAGINMKKAIKALSSYFS